MGQTKVSDPDPHKFFVVGSGSDLDVKIALTFLTIFLCVFEDDKITQKNYLQMFLKIVTIEFTVHGSVQHLDPHLDKILDPDPH